MQISTEVSLAYAKGFRNGARTAKDMGTSSEEWFRGVDAMISVLEKQLLYLLDPATPDIIRNLRKILLEVDKIEIKPAVPTPKQVPIPPFGTQWHLSDPPRKPTVGVDSLATPKRLMDFLGPCHMGYVLGYPCGSASWEDLRGEPGG